MDVSAGRFSGLYRRRKWKDKLMTILLWFSVALAVMPLLSILGYVTWQGIGSVNVGFFTRLPSPVGQSGGGMAHSIVGSGIVVGLAALMGLPVGVLAGIYLAEHGRHNRFGRLVRFLADVLQGIPSIVVGVVAFTMVVLPMRRFSAVAGAVALAMMLVPFVARTTEEALLATSDDIREAGMALGQPGRRVVLGLVLGAARGPLVAGWMLAIARIAGETAPLLFTALNNRFWHRGLLEPISTLTVQLYSYAIAPFDDWNRQAWAGALVLMVFILLMNAAARVAGRSKYGERN